MQKQTAVVRAEPSAKEVAKLSVILLFLVISATLMSTLSGFNGIEWIRWFLGGFMIVFGGLKLMGIEVFIKVFPLYDLIAKRFPPYKYLYPLLQVFLGMLFLIGIFSVVRDITVIVISLSGLLGMVKVVSQRGPVKLSYVGTLIRLRFSSVVLFENTVMVFLAIIMLIAEFAF